MKTNYCNLAKYFDHTLLKPTATKQEIVAVCNEALNYGFYSVCVNLCQVDFAKKQLDGKIKVCSVIDFPFGCSTPKSKLTQVKEAQFLGASEVDVVINLGKLLEGNKKYCIDGLEPICNFAHQNKMLVKVIVETCYLNEVQISNACEIVEASGADFIKTSTGYGSRGASYEDIILFKKYLNQNTKIKASGGIRTLEEVEKYLSLGCSRLGTSRTVSIINKALSKNIIAKN